MEKNWLIRTKSNHILGPISKDKVLELFHNGSIKPDDEVCSGNGYWFFIREDDQVKRYLLGEEAQGFNPISEAKNVLTQNIQIKNEIETHDDITKVGGVNLSQLKEEEKPEIPPLTEVQAATEIKILEISEKVESKKKIKNEINGGKTPSNKRSVKNQNLIKYVTWIGVVIFLLLIYYRKTVIKSFLKSSSISLMSSALAQETESKKKK